MSLKNTADSYGVIARKFHWVMALLVLGLLSVGFYMTALEATPFKFSVYWWHKSFGLLVLFLVTARLLWRFVNIIPAHMPSHAPWERTLAKLVHVLLYVSMIGLPLSGWFMSAASDYPSPFFGLFEMPDFINKDENFAGLMRQIHQILGYTLLVSVGLHFAGAAKHHIIDRDDTLVRMVPRKLALVVLLLGGLLIAAPSALVALNVLEEKGYEEKEQIESTIEIAKDIITAGAVPSWSIIAEESALAFEATAYGKPFTLEFSHFGGTILFDPENLEASRIDITIDMNDFSSGSAERDEKGRGEAFFDSAHYPTARFMAEMLEKADANRFIANGHLTIREVTKPVDLPFTLEFLQNEESQTLAVAKGEVELNRLDFELGTGLWESAQTLGHTVLLRMNVTALRQNSP